MTDPSRVLDLIDAFRRSKCMFTAVSLGLFDSTPATLEELTKRTQADAGALERLLDGCVSLGLMTKDGDRYTNTEPSDVYLRRNSPNTMTGYILYSDQVLYPLWGNLEDAVKEGTHRWKQTFDLDGALFSHFFRTPEAKYEFLLGMHGLGVLGSPKVVRAFDLSGFHRLVDLGGATGHLPNAAIERYPEGQEPVTE